MDQSWINDTNFLRRKWTQIGNRCSATTHKVHPRLSLLMAICTKGNLYGSLTQVNTD